MLTRGRKLKEKDKHLNLHKKTKQKNENNYEPKEKRIINKKGTLGSYNQSSPILIMKL